MQRAFKKIIERLEENSRFAVSTLNGKTDRYVAGVCDANRNAIEIVNQVASECGGGWIPCSERLPDKSGWFLCTQEYHSLKDGKVVKVTTELVEFYNNEWRRAKNLIVTHWRPLPAPYKAESEE